MKTDRSVAKYVRRAAGLVMAFAIAAAGGGDARAAETAISIAGSTALLPLLREAARVYAATHPEVTVSVEGGGSRGALARLATRSIDLAASDIAPESAELADHRIAIIPFVVAVGANAGVSDLSIRQLRDIFGGKIGAWNEVGGASLPIVTIDRTPSSGIRDLFVRALLGGEPLGTPTIVDEATSNVISDLQTAPGAIAYGNRAAFQAAGLKLISVDGVAPTDENILRGAYRFWAYEHLVTNGPATPALSRFLAFLETNTALLRQFGFVRITGRQTS